MKTIFLLPLFSLLLIPSVLADDGNKCGQAFISTALNEIDCFGDELYNQNQVIIHQNIEIIQSQQEIIKIGILNTCISQTSHDAISPYWSWGDNLQSCEEKVRSAIQ